MLDSRIEHINATLTELTELMQLVSKSYPEVPAILCKISLEKGEQLCEELRLLNTVKESVPSMEPVVDGEVSPSFSEECTTENFSCSASFAERKEDTEVSHLTAPENESEDNQTCDEPVTSDEDTTSETKQEEAGAEESVSEKSTAANESSEVIFAWDTTEEEFCLFDRIPETKTTEEELPLQAAPEDDAIIPESEKESSCEEEQEQPAPVDETQNDENMEVEPSDVSTEEASGDSVAEESLLENVESPQKPEAQDNAPARVEEVHHSAYRELQKMMSINDRFLFRRELFDNDGELMSQTIDALNDTTSYEESLAYLHSHFMWDFESETFELLRSLLQQRFEA